MWWLVLAAFAAPEPEEVAAPRGSQPAVLAPGAGPLPPGALEVQMDRDRLGRGDRSTYLGGSAVLGLGPRVRVGVWLRAGQPTCVAGCPSRLGGAGWIGLTAPVGQKFHLMPWLAAGTLVQPGLALWWSPDPQVVVDAAWGPAVRPREIIPRDRTWANAGLSHLAILWHPVGSVPEAGVTIALTRDGRLSVRLGMFGALPSVSVRAALGPIVVEGRVGFRPPTALGTGASAGIAFAPADASPP